MIDICIPTYNRFDKLLELVIKIAEIIGGKYSDKNIKIIVSDNGSSDFNENSINIVKKKYKFLKVYRQKTNIGFIHNINFLWSNSNNDYVWTISDDDYYSDQLVTTLIDSIIKNKDIDYIYLINSFHYHGFEGQDPKVIMNNIMRLNCKSQFIVFDDISQIANPSNFTSFGLLGASVFPRKLIDDYINEKNSNFYPHQKIIFNHYPASKIYVLNITGGLGWYANESNWSYLYPACSYKAHYLDYISIISNSYLLKNKKEYYDVIYKNSIKIILLYMLSGVDKWNLFVQIFRCHKEFRYFNIKYDFYIIFIMIIPGKYFQNFFRKRINLSLI